ncbi:anaerobic ribonucleoside-triphosphate reductase activating protein [Selenomonadales bacterium OttesenSCG-928-I06]|nr:anaerobic ribonucleoside-triphosphate reductase activating protein [Selenomonadales bacterium OttesenSCG-928-I06]
MIIDGVQKLSLLDFPDKTCCTLFTLGCNYCCPFCHNASLITCDTSKEGVSWPEVKSFLKKRQGLLDGVCISGGEPLLQDGLADFIGEIKLLGFEVKLDTNGSLPEKLKSLVSHGLIDYVAMDIKNSQEKYSETIGLLKYDLDAVKESVQFLLSGVVPYEFRTTVVRELHSEKDFLSIGSWLCGAEDYYLQCFVDSENVLRKGLSGYAKEELEKFKSLVEPFVKSVKIRGI